MTHRRERLRLRVSGPGRRILIQILAMALVAVVVGGLALLAQYRTAYDQQRERLLEIAQRQARVVETIVEHHRELALDPPTQARDTTPSQVFELALQEVQAAHRGITGFGETGEFTISELRDGRIVFLSSRRHGGEAVPTDLPADTEMAEPARRALQGESGTTLGPDYRGVAVLAAFEPVRVPGRSVGVVAKIDHAEFRRPFLNTAGLVGLAAVLIIIVGAWIARRIGEPLIQKLEESEVKYRRFFENSLEAFFRTLPEGRIVECNQAALDLFGMAREELIGRSAADFYRDPQERERFRQALEREGRVRDYPIGLRLPDGSELDCALTSVARHLANGRLVFETILRNVTGQRRAQEALRESEAKFRSLAESSPSAIYIEQGGRIVYVNPAGVALAGLGEEELTSTDFSWKSLIDPASADVVMDAYRRHERGEEVEPYEYRMITPDGKYRDVVNATRLVTFDGEPAVMGTVSDITAHKEIQDKLRGERDRTQIYLDTAEVMLVALDHEGRIEMVNRKGCEILGWEEDELRGQDWFRACIPDDVAVEVRTTFRRIMGGELELLRYYENDVVTKDGERRLIAWHNAYMRDADGNVVGTLSSGEDVTNLRSALRDLERSERQYRTAFEFANDGYTLLRNGRFIEVNRRAEEMYGRSAKELVGMHPWEVSPPLQPDGRSSMVKAEEALAGVMAGYPQIFEWMHKRADGTVFPAEISLTRLDLEDGPAVFAIQRDLSERYEAQEALRKSEQQLQMIADLLPAYVARLDTEARYTFANRNYQELAGMPVDQILGREAREVLGDEPFEGIAPYLERAFSGLPVSFEFFRSLDNQQEKRLAAQYVPELGAHGEVQGVVALIQDVTEAREAEARIRESEARFRTLFESTPLSAVHADLEGNILSCNRAFTQTHDTTDGPEAQVGRKLAEFFAKEDLGRLGDRIQAALDSKDPVGPDAYTMLKEDGRFFPSEAFTAAIRDEYGDPVSLVVHALDVTERKKAEEALAESERKFRLAFENASDAIVWAEVETGIIVNCNPAAEKLFERTKDELIGEPQTLLHPAESGEDSSQRFRSHAQTPDELVESRIITKSGEIREVVVSAARIQVEGKEILQGVFTDITDLIEAERALRESLQTSADIAETIPAGLFVYQYEASEGSEGLTLLYANPEAGVLTDLDAEEWIGKDFDEIWPNARDLGITEAYLNVARTGEVLKLEEEHYKDERLEGVFRTHVFPLPGDRLAVSFENITERKKAEDALRESEERFRILSDAAFEGIGVTKDGIVLEANDRLADMLGWSRKDLIGTAILDSVAPSSREMVEELTAAGVREPYEHLALKKDGTEFPVEVHGRPMPFRGEEVRVTAIRDITARKQAEAEIRESGERARALAARLQEIREDERTSIARELHDELGQAITGLRMDLAMFKADLPDEEEELHRRVDEMLEEADEHIVLVRSISSRLRPPVLDVLGLPAAVEWLVEEIEPRTEIVFELDLKVERVGLSRSASTAVFRIVQEALTNVVRHAQAERVRIGMDVADGHLRVDVHDDGVGISNTVAQYPRSLGLTGMHERATGLGASLEIRGDPGGGTRVTLDVPMETSHANGGVQE